MGSWLPIVQWIAPAATMIAAMMTASNLGARMTGWGFVVFTAGSVSWALIGASTGQASLQATNIFLTVVNLVGIWRWLGRQAKYQDGAKAAADESEAGEGPSLVPATGVSGLEVTDQAGARLGLCVEALIEQESGRIEYIVVATRNAVGLDEELRGVGRSMCRLGGKAISLTLNAAEFAALPVLPDRNWPARL